MSDDVAVAGRAWHVRASVRILADYDAGAVDPPVRRQFHAGEELVLVRWGRAGRSVGKDEAWWTSQDIDGTHIGFLVRRYRPRSCIDLPLPQPVPQRLAVTDA